MAVDGVKGNRNDNKTVIDEYRNREAELKKHYEKQVKRLQDDHAKSLNKVITENEAAVKAYTQEAQEKFNEKDLRNQEQIKELNRLHRNQMRRNAEHFEKQLSNEKAVALNTIENITDVKDEQRRSMKQNYDTYIEKQSTEFKDQVNKNRDMATEVISRERRQLQEKNEVDRRRMEKDRRQTVAHLQSQQDMIQRQKDAQIQFLKDENYRTKSDMKNKLDVELTDLAETNKLQQRIQREGFEDGLAKTREDSVRAHQQQGEVFEEALSDLRQKTAEKAMNTTHRLETELKRAKTEHARDIAKKNHEKRNEQTLMYEQIRERQDLMEKQRLAALADANDKHADAIAKINKENSNRMVDQATRYREKQMADSIIADTKVRDAVDSLRDQLLQKDTKMKVDFQREKARNNVDKMDLEERYRAMLERMRKTHAEHILDLKAQNMRGQNEAIGNLSRALKESENKNSAKIQQQAAQYDEKLMILESEKRNAVARERELALQRAKATERYHLLQMKTQEIQHQNQLAQIKEKYEYQLDQMQKKLEKMHFDHVRQKTT